jgi:hypothetical protein
MNDKLDLAAIRARCDAATPGPWEVVVRGNTVTSHAITVSDKYISIASGISPKTANAKFIAHAREDIPALIGEVERLQSDNKRLRNELCLKCGSYEMAHKGACDGCRWRDA